MGSFIVRKALKLVTIMTAGIDGSVVFGTHIIEPVAIGK